MKCRCGRPRSTTADLDRWHGAYPDGLPENEPPWAAEICWRASALDVCLMKPLGEKK